MAERPLLIFSTPELASKSRLWGGPDKVHRPSHSRQGQRLSPIFSHLQQAFTNRSVEIQQTMAGADPEQVIVLETIGIIDNFVNAVKRIEGLEWMGEIAIEEIAPDQDFYVQDKAEKELDGRLYMVMSNQKALNQMISLWNRYKNNPNMQFERGLTRFRYVFNCLKNIRRWDVQDRLMETGVLDEWKKLLDYGQRTVLVETELWFRDSTQKRADVRLQINQLIQSKRGRILSQCVIEEISYHALLTELPAQVAMQIISNPTIDFVKCDDIMFLRPVGQMITDKQFIGDSSDYKKRKQEKPLGNPIIAVLDGMPMSNHELLADRLVIDDPDDWSSSYPIVNRTHGTAMCSLIAHGDLNDIEDPLSTQIYIRPIMRPYPYGDGQEAVPQDFLIVDLIHSVVRRMFDGDGKNPPSAPDVKVINFSIGDPVRQFTQIMSPLARIIDWLSEKYNVLFVISAGNHNTPIVVNVSPDDFNQLSEDEKQDIILKSLYENTRLRKILSPAESINGLTIGALHYDSSHIDDLGDRQELYTSLLPSPVSAFGSGYRRAIKPDMLFPGGKILFRKRIDSSGSVIFTPAITQKAPGIQVASTSRLPGDIVKTTFCHGTSSATALVSRSAAICYEILNDIFAEQAIDISAESAIIPLIKAMLVHGCSWGDINQYLESALNPSNNNNNRIKNWISQWAGYGISDINKVLDCNEQRATMVGFGKLNDDEANIFRLPLPPSLSSLREKRKLTVTLAWLSPIASNTQKYRVAYLWFEVEDESLLTQRKEVDWRSARRGTLQHEVFEGERAVAIDDGDYIKIKVNCKNDAGKIEQAIPYGLVVSLEVAEGLDVPIYNEIKTRIATQIKID